MPLGIDCYRLYAIPRFAPQSISGVFGHDLPRKMSVSANEPGSRHNVSCFAGLVGHPSHKVALQMSHVGCGADFLCAHTLCELANHLGPSGSEICAFRRRAPRLDPPAPSVAEGKLRHAAAACG